jgi:hypothetical protein
LNQESFTKTADRQVSKVQEICDGDNFFASEFDKKVQHPDGDFTATLTLPWKQRVYCIRKGMIEENWIDGTAYDVPLNPYNVDVTGFSCDEIFAKFKDDVENGIGKIFARDFGLTSPVAEQRIAEVMKEEKFGQNFSKMIILGKIYLSDEEKVIEKATYVEYMNNFYSKAFEALKELKTPKTPQIKT